MGSTDWHSAPRKRFNEEEINFLRREAKMFQPWCLEEMKMAYAAHLAANGDRIYLSDGAELFS